MSTTQSERLRGLLEPLVVQTGLELEEVKVTAAGNHRQLQVIVDSEDGAPLDTLAELSREISQALDDADAMGGAAYLLEVSSPGVDRPLTEPRHFRRNEGRLVKLTTAGGEQLVARILKVDDEGLDLEIPGVKGRKPKPARVVFGDIAKARVEIEFSRKDPAGADTDGDESTEEA